MHILAHWLTWDYFQDFLKWFPQIIYVICLIYTVNCNITIYVTEKKTSEYDKMKKLG